MHAHSRPTVMSPVLGAVLLVIALIIVWAAIPDALPPTMRQSVAPARMMFACAIRSVTAAAAGPATAARNVAASTL